MIRYAGVSTMKSSPVEGLGVLKRRWHRIQKGVLWVLVLTAQCSLGQYCKTDVLSMTGNEFGNDYMFECADGAFVSEVTVSSGTDGFTGLILTCSDGEVSEVFEFCSYCETFFLKVDLTGGWTRLSATLSLDESETLSKASFFCFSKGDPSGASPGPYPSETNPDTAAEITAPLFNDDSYAVGVTVFEVFANLFGVALHCRTIDEASCPALDGLLVPGTTGTKDDGTDDPAIQIRTPGPVSESTTEPTPEPTPTPVSAVGVPTRLSPTDQPHPPTPSPFSAMAPPPGGGDDTPAATPTSVDDTFVPTFLDNDDDDEPYVRDRDSPATPSQTPQLTWDVTVTPATGTAPPATKPTPPVTTPPATAPTPTVTLPPATGTEPPATTPTPTVTALPATGTAPPATKTTPTVTTPPATAPTPTVTALPATGTEPPATAPTPSVTAPPAMGTTPPATAPTPTVMASSATAPTPTPVSADAHPTHAIPTGQNHPPTPSPSSTVASPPAAGPTRTPMSSPALSETSFPAGINMTPTSSPMANETSAPVAPTVAPMSSASPSKTRASVTPTMEPPSSPCSACSPLVPSKMPIPSLSPLATPATDATNTPATTPPPTVGPTVAPGFPDFYDAQQGADDVDGGGDASTWTKALTVILSTVAAAVTFFAFAFHRIRGCPDGGDERDNDGNNRNGGINGNTITCVCGCHNSIGDTNSNITPPQAEGHGNNVANGCTSSVHCRDDVFFSARSSPVHVEGFCNDIATMQASL